MHFELKKSNLRVLLLFMLLLMAVVIQYPAAADCYGFAKVANVEIKKTNDTNAKGLTKLQSGAKVTILETKDDWYKVAFDDFEGYVHADNLDLGAVGKKITINKTQVNVRSESNTSSKILTCVDSGNKVEVIGIAGQWYKVDVDGKKGYIRSDLLHEDDDTSSKLSPLNDDGLVFFDDEGELPPPIAEAQADAIKIEGDKASIKEAQEMLKKMRFFHGEPDGKAGSVTQSAIKAFQHAYDIEVDGSVGSTTTSKLKEVFASEKNQAHAGAVKVSANGVVLCEWFNFMKYHFPVYEPLRVVDVETGVEFKLRAFSAGNHADVEPPTKEDTDILYKINGNKWSWDPRPVWVYIEGVCYAAVINVKPHGPDTIADNGMSGQICMHFLYSRNHNTGQENNNMQAGVLESFENAAEAPMPLPTDFTYVVPTDMPQE